MYPCPVLSLFIFTENVARLAVIRQHRTLLRLERAESPPWLPGCRPVMLLSFRLNFMR